jgi:PAS domain S-box-containing protein
LQLSEKRYRELFESSPDMIALVNREGDCLLVNQRVQDLLGYEPEEMVSFAMTDLVDEAYRSNMNDFILQVFENGEANEIFKVHDKKGLEIYLEVVARIFQYDIDDRQMACFICRDITHRKRLEEELIQTERMAVMGHMAAGLAHEINNPLGIILANTEEVLYGGNELQSGKACLKAIERNAERAAKIIENLLSFTRPGTSKKVQADAIPLIEEAIFFLRQKLKKANIRVETNYETPRLMCYVDENQFQQMVINLMLNSIEAMPDGGMLTTSLKTDLNREESMLVLTIEDNGPGIPEKELSKVFNPFFTARKRKGFGLGLFITKGIVENHRGTISAVSRDGAGTTMRVELPIEPKGETATNLKDPEEMTQKDTYLQEQEREVGHG